VSDQVNVGDYSLEISGDEVVVRDETGAVVETVELDDVDGELTLPDGQKVDLASILADAGVENFQRAHARMHNEVVYRLREDGSEILIEANGTVRTTATDFHMNVGLRVTLDGAPFFERGWLETIPRRLV